LPLGEAGRGSEVREEKTPEGRNVKGATAGRAGKPKLS
jgi:hypothetical protein